MSKRAWMPLYVGDYLADTGHLNTTQHGAYLLLMMHYWKKGELPDDDKQLAAITKLPLRLWLDSRETVQAFFYDGWCHKRIDEELAVMEVKTRRRAAAGSKGGTQATINRWKHKADAAMLKQTNSNATAMHNHSHSPSKKEEEGLAKGKGEKPPVAASPELVAIMARKLNS
jgi:uncharacterized protein YdaU (DUF1376 family)